MSDNKSTSPIVTRFVLCTLLAAVVAGQARASAIITVVNTDAPGVGFNDPTPATPVGGNPGTTLGAQRLYAFQYAADLWGARINSSVPIVVDASFAPIADCNLGGSARPTAVYSQDSAMPGIPANTLIPVALFEKLQGVCRSPCTAAEIQAEFNGAIGTTCPESAWYYGLDSDTWDHDALAADLVSVVMHELAHGLGFLPSVDLSSGKKFDGLDDMFTNNLKDNASGKLWRDMTNAERQMSATNTNNVVWIGANTTAGTTVLTGGKDGGGHAELYAPASLNKDSSISHWNQQYSCSACDTLLPKDMMAPSYSGPTHYTVVTHLALQDIGWGAVEPGLVDLIVGTGGGEGTVTSVPSGIQYPGTASAGFPVGTQVTLTAKRAPGFEFSNFEAFSGFGINSVIIQQLVNPWTFTVDEPRLVRTKFIAMESQTLTVAKVGSAAGSVSSLPDGISSCTSICSSSFAYGTVVRLTASPLSGATFGGWAGEGCSGTGTCQVTMTQARSVTATFIGLGAIAVSANPDPVAMGLGSVITATVRDGLGQSPPTGTTVTFATTFPGFFSQGGICYGSCTSTTDASGVATQRFTGNAGGTANITVSAANMTSTIYGLTVQPQGPTVVTLAAAWDSATLISTTYRLDAVVTNASGVPQANQRVDFSAAPFSTSPTYGFTGGNGQTSSRVTVTMSGPLTAIATCNGVQGAVTINAQVGAPTSSPMTATETLAVPGGGRIYGVAFSPDGSVLIASSNNSNIVTAWNIPAWSQKWSRNTLTTAGSLYGLAISPNSSQVAVSSLKGSDIMNVGDGSPVCATNPPISDLSGGSLVAWTSNSSRIGSSTAHLFTYPSTCGGGTVGTALSFKDESHMDYSPTKGYAAAGVASIGEVYVWNASGGIVTHRVVAPGSNVYDTNFSTNGGKLAVVAAGPVIKVFDTTTWASISYSASSLGGGDSVYGVAFIDNDTKLAVGGANGKVEVLDLVSGGTSLRVGTVSGSVYELTWNQVTSDLAAGTSSGNVYVFRPLDPPDVSGPVISVTSPAEGSVTIATAIATMGEVTDQSGVATFTINGTSQTLDGGGNFSTVVGGLVEGSNTITYHAIDTLGNASNVLVHVTRVVDRTPPVISNVAVSPAAGAAGTLFGISCTVVDGDTGVGNVTATVRNSLAVAVGTVPMNTAGGGNYSGNLNSAGFSTGAYSVDIAAVDSSPQLNSTVLTGAGSFTVAGPQALTVLIAGNGAGTVTSGPAGISCGAACTASFTYHTAVTLTAVALSGAVFSGWSGEGCSGTGTCQVSMTQSRTVTATFGCAAVPATPVITQTMGTNPSCVGSSITLDAGAGYASYLWSTGATTRTITVSPSETTTYTVNGTNVGCSSSSAPGSWTQTVNAVPAKPTASNTGPYCAGGTISLSTPTVSGATYSWTGPNGFTSGLQNPTISNATAVNAGTYSVTVTVAGCTSAPGTTNVVVNAGPATPVITAPASTAAGTTGLTASVVSHAGSSWFWTILNGTIMSGQGTNQITFTAGMAGTPLTLSVTETNASACVSAPGNATVTVAGSAALFYTLPPCRVLDTRNPTGPLAGPSLQPGATRTFDVAASLCGIPVTAKAISVNLAVTGPVGPGYLTLYPGDAVQVPLASTINFSANQTRANNAVLPLASDGSGTINVLAGTGGTVDFILDVNGYFE